MALIALTTADTVDFVSKQDSDYKVENVPVDPNDPSKGTKEKVTIGEGACVFKVRPLDVFLMGHIYDNASHLQGRQGSDEVGIRTRVNQTNIDAVRFGLAMIPSNFRDKQGNAIRFKTQKAVVNSREYDVVADDVMSTLGLRLIAEMAERIKEISEVSAAEEKNSASA